MKSLHRSDGTVGNVKLNGKHEKVLSCKCCAMTNFKWSERIKEAMAEVKEYNEGEKDEERIPRHSS